MIAQQLPVTTTCDHDVVLYVVILIPPQRWFVHSRVSLQGRRGCARRCTLELMLLLPVLALAFLAAVLDRSAAATLFEVFARMSVGAGRVGTPVISRSSAHQPCLGAWWIPLWADLHVQLRLRQRGVASHTALHVLVVPPRLVGTSVLVVPPRLVGTRGKRRHDGLEEHRSRRQRCCWLRKGRLPSVCSWPAHHTPNSATCRRRVREGWPRTTSRHGCPLLCTWAAYPPSSTPHWSSAERTALASPRSAPNQSSEV
jgi:hypothetical protein